MKLSGTRVHQTHAELPFYKHQVGAVHMRQYKYESAGDVWNQF